MCSILFYFIFFPIRVAKKENNAVQSFELNKVTTFSSVLHVRKNFFSVSACCLFSKTNTLKNPQICGHATLYIMLQLRGGKCERIPSQGLEKLPLFCFLISLHLEKCDLESLASLII